MTPAEFTVFVVVIAVVLVLVVTAISLAARLEAAELKLERHADRIVANDSNTFTRHSDNERQMNALMRHLGVKLTYRGPGYAIESSATPREDE
jgi:signal transduction histidine kinase